MKGKLIILIEEIKKSEENKYLKIFFIIVHLKSIHILF